MTPITADDDAAQLHHLAARLASTHRELAARWLERLSVILNVNPNEVFPTSRLLDHIPDLIVEIAGHLPEPGENEITSNTVVMAKAAELGWLRFEQQASVHQVLREYQLFGDVLDEFFQHEIDEVDGLINPRVVAVAMSRAHQAIRVLERQTIDALVRHYMDGIERQNTRLRSFSRMVSHEIRQPLDVLQILAATLQVRPDDAAMGRMKDMLTRNVTRLGELSHKLEALARLGRRDDNTPNVQEVVLTLLARDVATQLKDMAESRNVSIEIADDLPALVVDPSCVELVLINLIANAVKYSDPGKDARWVRVEAATAKGQQAIQVRDNGIGIPSNKLPVIFEEFVRVHPHLDPALGAQGMGLGLSIVRECMDAMDATVIVESQEGAGTTFLLTWPRTTRSHTPES